MLQWCLCGWFAVDNLLKYIKQLGRQGRIHNPHLLGGGDVGPGRRSMQAMANVAMSAMRLKRKSSVSGIIRRTCSIQVEAGDMPGTSDFLLSVVVAYNLDCLLMTSFASGFL